MEFPSYRSRFFWGVPDLDGFQRVLGELMAQTRINKGWFAGDNLIAFGRNLGFMSDQRFMTAWGEHAKDIHERGVLWRTATVIWAARQALRRQGDFVECGCYKGTSARILIDSVDLGERQYFLYDLFDHDASMNHNAMPDHGAGLFAATQARFAAFPNVKVIQGAVPESFSQGLPDKIAFAHIDMNNAPAEIGALEAIEERLVPGAVILLDDFGALPYRAQHVAETEWFGKRGIPVLELPTSQGLVIW